MATRRGDAASRVSQPDPRSAPATRTKPQACSVAVDALIHEHHAHSSKSRLRLFAQPPKVRSMRASPLANRRVPEGVTMRVPPCPGTLGAPCPQFALTIVIL